MFTLYKGKDKHGDLHPVPLWYSPSTNIVKFVGYEVQASSYEQAQELAIGLGYEPFTRPPLPPQQPQWKPKHDVKTT